jgi:GT2 family glycosyltransferase
MTCSVDHIVNGGCRVSIITPSYNAGSYLRATIDSVRAQTSEQWEHVIVDDGSTDGSVHNLRVELDADRRYRFVVQPNQGVASARNAGYRATSPCSEYLIFVDADDCLEPTAIATLTTYLDGHADVGVVYSSCSFIDETGEPLVDTSYLDWWRERYALRGFKMAPLPPNDPVTPFESIFVAPNLLPSCTMIRRCAYEQTSGWDETLGQPSEDTDLFLRLALSTAVHHLPDPLLRYRRHSVQSTAQQGRLNAQAIRLYAKWSALARTDTVNARTIDRAIRVREGFAVPGTWIGWGTEHLRAGHVMEGCKSYARAIKYGGKYWTGQLAALRPSRHRR